MYNVTEKEFRAIEQIEEGVIQNVFKTLKSCPRHLLYLEGGMVPARHQVRRMKLNFLHYILNQPNDSLMFKMFKAEMNNPTKGDWVSEVKQLLVYYKINLTLHEIECMPSSQYKKIVKQQVIQIAFEALSDKQKFLKKGKLIHYERLEMSDYLLPTDKLSVAEQHEMFSLRCEMNDIPYNYGNRTYCETGCGQILNNEHLLMCPIFNEGHENKYTYINFLNGTLFQKIEIFKKIKEITEKTQQLTNSVIQLVIC